MSIRDINIKNSYVGKGEIILQDFLIPALKESYTYDRITSFYSIDSLLAISQGIESLFEQSGKMRLIIGLHSVPNELLDAITKKEFLEQEISDIRERIRKDISSLSDLLEKQRIATLAWMVEDELLEIRAVAVEGRGIFHPKTLILSDEEGNTVVAIGSPNETGSGLGGNYEQVIVSKSWEHPEVIEAQRDFFEMLWSNKADGVHCLNITKEVAEAIKEAIGSDYENPRKTIDDIVQVISDSKNMPAYFFVSGSIPALYMHQERAVIDALSRWPVRVLLSDEVGLGKTFEAASTLVYLHKFCSVNRVVILTPKSVLYQWQDELFDNFGLDAWVYDSSRKEYISPKGDTIHIYNGNPLCKNIPNIVLISAQFSRGSGRDNSIFEREGVVLPDLLIVDEAHSARVSRDISGKRKKTRMYKMLESISEKIPHIVLATATPMQTDAAEYHALLSLLGLPKGWRKERQFRTSLKIIGGGDSPDLSDASTAGSLICSVVEDMKLQINSLETDEKRLINKLVHMKRECDSYDLGSYVLDNWETARKLLVKIHPARLLTIRNTRRSLTEVGYSFPIRNLNEISVPVPIEMQLFYQNVNDYISEECFSIEKALDSDKNINLGFIRVNYQQRVASSLYSCKESLKRRYLKALQLRNTLLLNGVIDSIHYSDGYYFEDVIEDSEIAETSYDFEDAELAYTSFDAVDLNELKRAIQLECTSLGSLIKQAQRLLEKIGDLKIQESIRIAIKSMEKGDAVLLFSRYTDTVDALIKAFEEESEGEIAYGIYTGKTSSIVRDGRETPCDKSMIKKELFDKSLRIVICSDAASEGLNLQAARVLINVDVPWTPSRLEQRIGRVARLGQTAKEVDIYNVWYPDSIEARMYHRIQKRLKDTNLAIGEFPDVIANSIKEAVLEDSDTDDSLEQLNDLRNSYQMKALEELWHDDKNGVTTTSLIRNHLIDLAKRQFKIRDELAGGITFIMPDGDVEFVTEETGLLDTISLGSNLWDYTEFSVPCISIKKNKTGTPIAFYSNVLEKELQPETIFEIAMGKDVSETMAALHIPNIMPDNTKLDLQYSNENSIQAAPELWPQSRENDNEG